MYQARRRERDARKPSLQTTRCYRDELCGGLASPDSGLLTWHAVNPSLSMCLIGSRRTRSRDPLEGRQNYRVDARCVVGRVVALETTFYCMWTPLRPSRLGILIIVATEATLLVPLPESRSASASAASPQLLEVTMKPPACRVLRPCPSGVQRRPQGPFIVSLQ